MNHQEFRIKCKDKYCGNKMALYDLEKRRWGEHDRQNGSLYSQYFQNVNQVQGIRIVPPRRDQKQGQSKENQTDAEDKDPAWFGIAPDAQNFYFLRYQQPM